MNAARALKHGIPATFDLREEYRRAFQQYLQRRDEASLGLAYELGRKALSDGKSLMELAAAHSEVLGQLAAEQQLEPGKLLESGGAFLAEAVSPYEMAHRGFQEAVTALRQMNERLEEQIKRIAYAVHDDAGQLLVAVHLALASLATELPKAQQEEIVRIEALLNDVEKQLRQYSHELRPTVLDDLGWLPAIRVLADNVSRRSRLSVQVDAEFSGRLAAGVEIALYRVVQEALTNAVKHSHAATVWISARKEGNALRCSVRDNGVGFDPQALRGPGTRRGIGLSGMQERMNAVGGSVEIQSSRGRGTELRITLPLENDHADSSSASG
jgi:signal transduction histidine kinase